MNIRMAILACALLATQSATAADTVVATTPDTAPGKGIGGMTGFLIGGALGGPLGAIGAGLAGLWLGGEAQAATGVHDEAYVVRREDGSTRTVRSPNLDVDVGDEVRIEGRRLVRAESGSSDQVSAVLP
jgi:outer membrane lipoprotein SlyB